MDWRRLFIRKTIEQIQAEADTHGLRRTLGPLNLVMIGVGCIIGAGIYVMTGNAAATYAGPAVMISFVIAGLACGFAAVCYAELAACMPVAGSSYTYAYAALGEVCAWAMAWLLVLEYGVAAATVAVGFSGYAVSLLGDLGVQVPSQMASPLIQSIAQGGGSAFHLTTDINLVAAGGIAIVTLVLIRGVTESAFVNALIVALKVGVLLAFVAFGAFYVHAGNWRPFLPPNEGGFAFGWPGVLRAASVIFFAYIGFEAVAIASSEAKSPRRDVPIGILGALAVCTVLYIAVAAVLTGVAPYRELGVAEPLAVAVDRMHAPWFARLIKLGAMAGLSSVMLILTYGQSRLFFAMARDGLLPPLFARLHARHQVPTAGTLLLGGAIALTAAFLPITILGDLVSLGTTVAFAIVAISLIQLRNARPDLERPFRAPGGGFRVRGYWIGWAPLLAIAFSVLMASPLLLDVMGKFAGGDTIPGMILMVYIAAGAAIYLGYGLRRSRLAGERRDLAEAAAAPAAE